MELGLDLSDPVYERGLQLGAYTILKLQPIDYTYLMSFLIGPFF